MLRMNIVIRIFGRYVMMLVVIFMRKCSWIICSVLVVNSRMIMICVIILIIWDRDSLVGVFVFMFIFFNIELKFVWWSSLDIMVFIYFFVYIFVKISMMVMMMFGSMFKMVFSIEIVGFEMLVIFSWLSVEMMIGIKISI